MYKDKKDHIYTDQFIHILEALDWIALNLPYTLAGVLPAKIKHMYTTRHKSQVIIIFLSHLQVKRV